LTTKFTLPVVATGIVLGTALAGGAFYYKAQNGSPLTADMPSAPLNSAKISLNDQDSVTLPADNFDTLPSSLKRPAHHAHYEADNLSGAFLSSLFAQRHQQWDAAATYLDVLQDYHTTSPMILKKAIVLEMGANNPNAAIKAAKDFLALDNDDYNSRALANLFIIADTFKQHDYDAARAQLSAMPDDGLTLFMKPVFQGWLDAMDNTFYKPLLHGHRMHLLNAAYIAHYIGDKKNLKKVLSLLESYEDLPNQDRERIADIYMATGQKSKAKDLYAALIDDMPTSHRLVLKAKEDDFQPALSLYQITQDPAEGLAYAVYEMANLLFNDGAHDSARIFTNMALYLDPSLDGAHILKAKLALEFENYAQAVQAYSQIPQTSPYYYESQLEKAKALDDANAYDKAIAHLASYYKKSNDLQALILTGDLQRQHENYDQALRTYNAIIDNHLKGITPANLWYLHYTRGMVLEQLNQWEAARSDLNKALEFYPNHPFVLNFLGYAMADRGEDLDEALGMIDKALSMQPYDGYITDSLGWVYYQMGRYNDAVPYLERAVELMPADPVINDHLGDAYWQVGRKIEARYQWKRAKNAQSIDADLLAKIDDKLAQGLTEDNVIQAAHSDIHTSKKQQD
tara:strand:- start:228 stop:2108 length:1881 start_codon:yes stop_codon:yes gene_type:complete